MIYNINLLALEIQQMLKNSITIEELNNKDLEQLRKDEDEKE